MDVVTDELSRGILPTLYDRDTLAAGPAQFRIVGEDPGLNQLDAVPVSTVVGDVIAKTTYGQERDS